MLSGDKFEAHLVAMATRKRAGVCC